MQFKPMLFQRQLYYDFCLTSSIKVNVIFVSYGQLIDYLKIIKSVQKLAFFPFPYFPNSWSSLKF